MHDIAQVRMYTASKGKLGNIAAEKIYAGIGCRPEHASSFAHPATLFRKQKMFPNSFDYIFRFHSMFPGAGKRGSMPGKHHGMQCSFFQAFRTLLSFLEHRGGTDDGDRGGVLHHHVGSVLHPRTSRDILFHV